MKLAASAYRFSVPWYLRLPLGFVGMLALTVLCYFVAALLHKVPPDYLKDYGTQGDFFGGHIAAVIGCITLLVVVVTGFLQVSYDRRFRLREHFLSGIDVIGQYDIASPGCEQALRLLDYYSAIALELDDIELLLLLNTVMTAKIRSTLEALEEGKQETYLDAREARRKIQQVLKDYHLQRKRIKKA